MEYGKMHKAMLQITPDILIDERDLVMEFVRASGPGGQNVNKVSTAVQLRFDVAGSSLPADVKRRLASLAGKRMTEQGVLVLDARTQRSQTQNRQDAIDRFVELVRKAAIRPKPRRATKPSLASKRRRVESKKRRGETKRLRSGRSDRE